MTLRFPIDGPRKISARWDELRPLSAPVEERNHVHGAIDIAAPVGTSILAPEDGSVFYYRALRPNDREVWDDEVLGPRGLRFPFKNYFYDTFGAIAILEGDSGLVHLFAHSYFRQHFSRFPAAAWTYQEQIETSRFVIECMHTFTMPRRVYAGREIARSGNAGYSSGPHIHWEIHKKPGELNPFGERPDPESFIFGASE